jgi:Ca2+-binding RTX toxin-like protein
VKQIKRITILATAGLMLTFVVASVAYAATFVGDNGSNALIGTPNPDTMRGLGGYDVLEGRGGHDKLYGGADRDEVYGGKGRDLVVGGSGRENWISGGSGNDTIKARDDEADFVHCGAGFDVAWIDERDAAQMCEIVNDRQF